MLVPLLSVGGEIQCKVEDASEYANLVFFNFRQFFLRLNFCFRSRQLPVLASVLRRVRLSVSLFTKTITGSQKSNDQSAPNWAKVEGENPHPATHKQMYMRTFFFFLIFIVHFRHFSRNCYTS